MQRLRPNGSLFVSARCAGMTVSLRRNPRPIKSYSDIGAK